jgi:hypothetical protein
VKVGVVELCLIPLVATSQKHMFCPLKKWKNPFKWQIKKTLVTKVAGNGNMHITAKNGVKIQKFAI